MIESDTEVWYEAHHPADPGTVKSFSLGWTLHLTIKVFSMVICGKMARIMCCTLDVYTCDETIVVDWLSDGRPSLSHCLTFCSLYDVHKGWTLLAWTVPEHIHLICKDTTDVTWKKFMTSFFALIKTTESWSRAKLVEHKVEQLWNEQRECEDLIGTHCSWEELHLSQVLVTTQMICRYYWNLGAKTKKNTQRTNEASQAENTQTEGWPH